jgi:hypothetical protein
MLEQFKALFFGSPRKKWLKYVDVFFVCMLLLLLTASFLLPYLSSSRQVSTPATSISSGRVLIVDNGPLMISSMAGSSEQRARALPTATPMELLATPTVVNSDSVQATYVQQLQQQIQTNNQTASEVTKNTKIPDNDWLIGNNGLLAQTDIQSFSSGTPLDLAWLGVLVIADLLLVVFFIVKSVRNAQYKRHFHYAEIIKTLPRVGLAFVAAHLSWLCVICLIQVNNGLCLAVAQFARHNEPGWPSVVDLGSLVSHAFAIVASVAGAIASSSQGATLSPGTAQDILPVLIGFTAILLYLLLAIQLIVRTALINLLFVLAPLSFACWALPQRSGQKLTLMWLTTTFAVIMIQFLQLACYTVSALLLNANSQLIHLSILGIEGASLLRIAILWLTLRIVGLVQNAVTSTMAEKSRNALTTIYNTTTSAVSAYLIALR